MTNAPGPTSPGEDFDGEDRRSEGAALPAGAEVLGSGRVTGYEPGHASDDQPSGGRRAVRRRARRWVAAGATAALVAGVGVGGVWAANALSGGGAQPAAFLPADAIAYAALDLDPAAEQKIGAIRFLRSFPDLTDHLGEDLDPRKGIFDALAEDDDALEGIDWEEDVAPWLGSRVGIAVLPAAATDAPEAGDSSRGEVGVPDVVVAVQVEDEDAAERALPELMRETGTDDIGVAVRDGYAILAEDRQTAERASASAEEQSLSEDEQFRTDMQSLGESGVSAAWVDVDAVGQVMLNAMDDMTGVGAAGAGPGSDQLRDQLASTYQGRYAMAIRFEGSNLELVAEGHGVPDTEPYSGEGAADLGQLPASTVAAAGLAHADEVVTATWERFIEQMATVGMLGPDADSTEAAIEGELGLNLPEDLAALLGSQTIVAMDGAGLAHEPLVGARATTDADRAESVLDTLQAAAAAQGAVLPELARVPTGDGLVVATTEDYARQLAQPGDLGSDAGFRSALPEAAGADAAAYVDLDGLADALGSLLEGDDSKSLAAFDAAGVTMSSDGDGSVHMLLRIVTK